MRMMSQGVVSGAKKKGVDLCEHGMTRASQSLFHTRTPWSRCGWVFQWRASWRLTNDGDRSGSPVRNAFRLSGLGSRQEVAGSGCK